MWLSSFKKLPLVSFVRVSHRRGTAMDRHKTIIDVESILNVHMYVATFESK